jgi:hypothetical protein
VSSEAPTPDAPNTLNRFAVGVNGDGWIVILNLPLLARLAPAPAEDHHGRPVSPALPEWPAVAPLAHPEALNLAAWLVAVSGQRAVFLRLLDAVERT